MLSLTLSCARARVHAPCRTLALTFFTSLTSITSFLSFTSFASERPSTSRPRPKEEVKRGAGANADKEIWLMKKVRTLFAFLAPCRQV